MKALDVAFSSHLHRTSNHFDGYELNAHVRDMPESTKSYQDGEGVFQSLESFV